MIEVLLSWVVIFISAYLWGMLGITGFSRALGYGKANASVETMDLLFFFGVCLLNVYAQIFSLFYKVVNLALLGVLLVDVLAAVLLRTKIAAQLRRFCKQISWKKMLVAIPVGLYILAMTAQKVTHYDTYLYHAQAIRWIEEYGAVKGLGNLHNRFAYGSAFFCLQALFSFSGILGRSLHTVNGILVLVFIYHSLFSAKYWKDHRFHASDGIRLAMIGTFCRENTISSPGSDIAAVGLVVYLLCKWVSFQEDREEWLGAYILLCFLAVWTASIKLSAALLVLLSIYPIIRLAKARKIRGMVCCIVIACLIAAPFFVRNVITSGYLIYPYPEVDLFSVDWKMSAQTALSDRLEINAWGWGVKDQYDAPMNIRLSTWYSGLNKMYLLLAWATLAALLGGYAEGLYQVIRRKNEKRKHDLFILSIMTAGLLLWFFGAPLLRYGKGYLMVIPLFVIFNWLDGQRVKFGSISVAGFACVMALICFERLTAYEIRWLKASEYETLPYVEHKLEDIVFYTPHSRDQLGYDAFPSAPYAAPLERIELRDGTLAGGFRLK